MSSGSSGDGGTSEASGPEQDPWSRPADFGQPGPTAPPPADPGSPPAETPASWSQPAPDSWTQTAPAWTAPGQPPAGGQPAQPPAGGQPAQPPAGGQPAQPLDSAREQSNGFGPGSADPWTTQRDGYPPAGSSGYPPPAGSSGYQPPAGPSSYPPPAGPYGPPAPYGYQPYPRPPAGRNNPLAIAALVCGIAQVVLFVGNILLAIPAIILGAIGLRQITQRGERGRGMAIAGLILGVFGVAFFLLIVMLIVIGLNVKSGSGSG